MPLFYRYSDRNIKFREYFLNAVLSGDNPNILEGFFSCNKCYAYEMITIFV